jgi:hypothetical protein
MKHLKSVSKILLAALFVPLFSVTGVRAADPSFDSNTSGGGISVDAIKAQAKADSRTPVPSTYVPNTELTNFWGNLNANTKDKLCKAANIKVNQNANVLEKIGIEGGIKREFKNYPDQRLALVDEISLKLSASLGTEVLSVPNVGGVSVGISAGLEGRSVVVRPLEDNRYCKNLSTLVKLYDMKLVLPITPKRINGMEIGEIWKLPVVVRYSFGVGVGANIAQAVTVSIGASETKERKPTISLYNMDANTLRVRFRVDHVTVKCVGVQANTIEIPAGDIGGMNGEGLIAKTVNRALASQINKFIAFKLGYSYVRVNGQKLLLEFYVDPNNQEQVEKLSAFAKGNLGTIEKFIKMGLRFDQFAEDSTAESGVGEIEDLATQVGAQLGSTNTFAGTDHYNSQGHNFNITIPVIHSHQSSWTSAYHRYQSLNNEGGTIHVQQKTKISNGDSLNIPFAGTMIKYNSTKDLYVVNKESKTGAVSRPVLLYQKYEGFVRQGDPRARVMIDNANNVLKYAGRKGDGTDSSNTLPSADIFPPLPPEEHSGYDDNNQQDPTKTYRSAVMSFKLVFAEQAVQDIIFAPAQIILKSFMNVMRETEGAIVDKIMDLFTFGKKGEVTYDYRQMQKRLEANGFNTGNNNDGGTNPLDVVRNLASAATHFIQKITSVKEESNWKAQSEKLAQVASSGDMKYEDFLKVVIQLVDVKDISSDVYVHTDKRVKGEPDVTQNYTMFNTRDNGFDSTIADVTQMRQRFADPSDLTD